jgi:hypothetical protein
MVTEEELHKRRASDIRKLNIEDMIADENDPKQRAFLIVLNSINTSLVANTNTIREISSKLETHLTKFEERTKAEDALVNKGKGAWTILAWVLGVAQVIVGGLWVETRSDINDLAKLAVVNNAASIKNDTRLLIIESTIKDKNASTSSSTSK